MHNLDLCVSFKGQRNYIHGTDLYSSSNRLLSSIGKGYVEKLSLKRKAHTSCILNLESPSGATIATGTFVYQESGNRRPFNIDETGEPVLGRYEFEDAKIINKVYIEEGKACLSPKADGHTTIEQIVAITKALHNQTLPLSAPDQWLFAQLELKMELPEHFTEACIKLEKLVKQRFSVNTISIDSQTVGEIRFITGSV